MSFDGWHNHRIEFTKREALRKTTRAQGRFELRIPERRSTNGWNNHRDAFTEIEARNPLYERQICTFIKSEPKDADSEPLIAQRDRSSNNIAEAQVNEIGTHFVKSKPLEQYRCATNVDTSSSNREWRRTVTIGKRRMQNKTDDEGTGKLFQYAIEDWRKTSNNVMKTSKKGIGKSARETSEGQKKKKEKLMEKKQKY